MEFSDSDLDYFLEYIWDNSFENNLGGMASPDMFTLFLTLEKIKPDVVVESGVWNGLSTKLIRKTLGSEVKIICLDPRPVPYYGYIDDNKNTKYHVGKDFIDFSKLDLTDYNSNKILCFFDCHQNAALRLLQCNGKNIRHILLNDNYPFNCGSHFTIEHLKNDDYRNYVIDKKTKQDILDLIEIYHIFPNIYPGEIKTGEGLFDCESYYKNDNHIDNFNIFKIHAEKYRWNTYIKLNSTEIQEKPIIYIPKQPQAYPVFRHVNDTARELIKLWEEAGLCEIKESSNPHIWWGSIGTILLYDRPTLEQIEIDRNLNYQLVLLGNPDKPSNRNNSQFSYWIFWARRPRLLEKFRLSHASLDYHQRKYNTIFLGKIENPVQKYYRPSSWAEYVDLFEMAAPGESHKYNQEEYLELLANSRFGLCLRGYGPKCNREIELLALGTVLLVTPEVDTNNYYNPLIEGTHYLKVEAPENIPEVISKCSPKKWSEMSKACRVWYLDNASPLGSFKTTNRIIEQDPNI